MLVEEFSPRGDGSLENFLTTEPEHLVVEKIIRENTGNGMQEEKGKNIKIKIRP